MPSSSTEVYLGVRTCEIFLCFVAIVRVRAIMVSFTGSYTEVEPGVPYEKVHLNHGYK